MAGIRNILLIILIVSGIIYGGIKGYLYFQVKKHVDQFVLMASPFATVEYDGISTTLEGVVILDNIKIRPLNIADAVRIDSLMLITPGIQFLLGDARESASQGKFPEKMGISIIGAHLNLSGELANLITQAEVEEAGYSPETGLACTLNQSFMIEQYKELGINELVIDTTIKIKYNENLGSLSFNMHYALQGVDEIDIEFSIEQLKSVVTGAMSGAPFSPPLKSVQFTYHPDPEFLKHVKQYCAKLKGISADEFIEQLIAQSDEVYIEDLGFIPGPGIRSAIKRLMTEAGELRIVALSGDSVDLSKLHLYKEEDIPNLLGLLVTVNGETINDLSFTISASSKSKLSMLGSLLNQGKTGVQQSESQQEKNKKELKYHIVERGQIGNKIGLKARIKTTDGKSRSGRITRIKDKIITLETRIYKGTVSVHIPISKTARIEVQEWL